MTKFNVINEGYTSKELSTIELSSLYGGAQVPPCVVLICGGKVCGADNPCAGKGACAGKSDS